VQLLDHRFLLAASSIAFSALAFDLCWVAEAGAQKAAEAPGVTADASAAAAVEPASAVEPSPVPATIAAPLTAANAPTAEAPAPALSKDSESSPEGPDVSVVQGKGLTVTSADKKFQVTFRSRVQMRSSFQHDGVTDLNTNEAQIKTLRFFASGYALSPDLKYTIQLAFGSGDFDKDSSSPIFDAFVEYVKLRDLNIRVGQYFVPFDRARTIREFALQFVDRQGVVRELTLDRDVGIMFSSQDLFGLNGKLAYNLFVGGGDGRNRVADKANRYGPQKPGVLGVARVTVRPMGPFDDDQEGDLTRSQKPHLAIGAAAGYNLSTNRQKSTYGNTDTQGTFNYLHAAADLVFKWHGLSILTEGVLREANKKQNVGMDADGKAVTELSRSGWGYFVQAGQMLSDKLEVTARWDDLRAKKGTDPALVKEVQASGRQAGGGLNLYLNGHFLKLQSDYFFIFGDETSQAAHAARVQLDASF